MIQIQSIERASADLPDGATVGAVVVVLLLPDPDASDLIAATTDSATTPSAADCRAIARPIGLALKAAVDAGKLDLP